MKVFQACLNIEDKQKVNGNLQDDCTEYVKDKYEKEAKVIASKLGAYLVKDHGTAVYKIFSAEYQSLTKKCKWINALKYKIKEIIINRGPHKTQELIQLF